MRHAIQVTALHTAIRYISAIPAEAYWSLTVTDDDDASSPSVLNLYAPEEYWPKLQSILGLKNPTDRSTNDIGEQFITYRDGALNISLIDIEEMKIK